MPLSFTYNVVGGCETTHLEKKQSNYVKMRFIFPRIKIQKIENTYLADHPV